MTGIAEENQVVPITLTVNGRRHRLTVEPRKLLADVLRQDLKLTGLNIGCAHGVCGSCTILLDGQSARSCVMFGVQADGAEITTIEGIAPSPVDLHPVQEAFWEQQGLQCGYCTPGMVLRIDRAAAREPQPDARRGSGGDLQQPLPLHGIPVHHRRRDGRGRAAPRRRDLGPAER